MTTFESSQTLAASQQRQGNWAATTLELVRSAPITLALIAAAVVVQFMSPLAPAALEFHRTAIEGGQAWRLVTGHFTHWNADHLFWDGVMFLLLGAVCERRSTRGFVGCLAISIAAISAAVWIAHPTMEQYRGLSGVDSALFTLAAGALLGDAIERRQRLATSVIGGLLVGLVAKILFEAITGTTLFVDSSTAFVPLPLVHLVGGCVGGAIALLDRWAGRARP